MEKEAIEVCVRLCMKLYDSNNCRQLMLMKAPVQIQELPLHDTVCHVNPFPS